MSLRARVPVTGVAALLCSSLWSSVAPAHAGGDDPLSQLAATVRARLDALVAAHAPKLVPPTPITVIWKDSPLGSSIDMGGPLIALTAANLDGDKKGELYAVTPREVIAIGFRNGKAIELGRVAFSGERAIPAPRDEVGTAVVEGGELVAAASPWAKELRITWRNKTLVARPGGSPFLVCPTAPGRPAERVQLTAGRNYFTNHAYAVRCRDDLVDAQGAPLQIRAELAKSGKLSVVVQKCLVGQACQPVASDEYANVGVAFELADVDRDGTPEVIVSEASAPGESDIAKVFSLGGEHKKGRFQFRRSGGFAGLVTVDLDGNGVAEVVAAVRLLDSTRVDFWRLD